MGDKLTLKERLDEERPYEIVSVPILKDNDIIYDESAVATLEEAERVWPILAASLDPEKGYGLAACQIGVLKKIAYIKYGDKEYKLLNTRITSKTGEIILPNEGCLSLPGKTVNTIRYAQITVEDDVLGKLVLTTNSDGLLPIIFQHEVDHFEGHTIMDRKRIPIRKTDSPGRNDSCPCGSGKKYKKCCMNNP